MLYPEDEKLLAEMLAWSAENSTVHHALTGEDELLAAFRLFRAGKLHGLTRHEDGRLSVMLEPKKHDPLRIFSGSVPGDYEEDFYAVVATSADEAEKLLHKATSEYIRGDLDGDSFPCVPGAYHMGSYRE